MFWLAKTFFFEFVKHTQSPGRNHASADPETAFALAYNQKNKLSATFASKEKKNSKMSCNKLRQHQNPNFEIKKILQTSLQLSFSRS